MIGKPGEGKLDLDQTKAFLKQALGSSPDSETLLEWIRFGHVVGYVVGEGNEQQVYIAEDSLQSLVTQVENRRETRLALRAVDVWKRKLNHLAVAVTLANRSTVVTTEQLCKNEQIVMLEAAVRATLAAISDLVNHALLVKFLRVKQHFLAEVGQSVVTVLIETGEGEATRRLPGIAKVSDSNALEAAARATLNALNRTLSPYLSQNISWRDVFKKVLPIK